MTDETTFSDRISKIPGYFNKRELGIIIALAVIAFLTSRYGLHYILPGGSAPGFVHGFLKLPGPGAGIFISSAFICLWLVLGLLLVKKPGTAVAIAVLTFVFTGVCSLLIGSGRMDYLLIMVSIIIEIVGLLAIEKKPWSYIFPAFLAVMGIITLLMMMTGQAKMGESGAAATVFPLGYALTGLIALALAVICYMYPMKYVAGAGFAEIFYIVYCWLFNGRSGFATWVPVTPAIPPLLSFALVCGSVMGAIAYGIYHLWKSYENTSSAKEDTV